MLRRFNFCSLCGLFLFVLHGSLAQRVKVQPEVVSYPGQTVTLRCQFPDPGSTELTQVSWILEPTSGVRTNIAVFNPRFGVNYPKSPVSDRVRFMIDPPSLDSPTIEITNIQLTDEGRYICEYATYPSGNEQGLTSLVILAKPVNKASVVPVSTGSASVVVARCESANGRPAATVSWETTMGGNASTPTKTENANNTVTMTSEYWLVPTPEDNGRDITCIVAHRTQSQPERFPMKLSVEYPPQVKILGYDNNWYIGRTNVVLTCQGQGNPLPTTLTWRTLSGRMPDTVTVSENKLTVQKVDETVNTTFICEAMSRVGGGKDQLSVIVRDAPVNPSNAGVVAGAVIGILVALLLIGALVGFLITCNRRQHQGYRGNGGKANATPYDSLARLFGSGSAPGKNGTGNNGNNNTPIYKGEVGLSEKAANHGPHQGIGGGVALLETTPTAQDILLSSEMDEAERRKFDELEEEDERYDHFRVGGPILQIRPHDDDDHVPSGYLDDDMESQRDGSVISRTAVYV